MTLSHKNCQIEITSDKIECEYLYLANKTIRWEIFLNEKLQFQKIILVPEEIAEFQFEIADVSHKGFLTQEAVIFYLKKNETMPIEFFRFCVIEEETKLSSQTKSYEFANEILKTISQKYNIPFLFKYYVETKKKEKNLNVLLIFLMILLLVFILTRGL
ncbi:hypothetical protein [Flavobacterium anhuiense]|uniref:hypothetical protein n=1 Tax=Flavobacterium anhuiense TaxID=459526 RepID=UPI003D96A522